MMTSAKLREYLYQKIYFLKLQMCVYLRRKCQVSNIVVTGFRQFNNLMVLIQKLLIMLDLWGFCNRLKQRKACKKER